jgi:chemotaxis protein MotB
MEAGADLEAPRDPFKPITIGGDDDYLGDAKPVTTTAPEQAQAKASSRPNSPSSSQPQKNGAQSEHGAQTAQSVSPDHAASSGQSAGTGQLTPSKASAASAPAPLTSVASAKTSHARRARQDTTTEASQLRKDLTKEIATVAASQPGPGVEVKATDDGILISLTDQLNFSMFPIGSAEPQPKVVRIMEKIAQSLKGRPGEIILRGHTDGRPYKSATYDNWRLSSARAQMTYYMLVRGGLSKTRFERIEGYGDRRLKNSREPYAAENRRIEILVRKEKP